MHSQGDPWEREEKPATNLLSFECHPIMDIERKKHFIIYLSLAIILTTLYWLVEVNHKAYYPVDPLPNLPNYYLELPLPSIVENLIHSLGDSFHIPTGFQEGLKKIFSSFMFRAGLLIPAGIFWGLALGIIIPSSALAEVNSFLQNIKKRNLLILLFLIPFALTISISSFLYHHEVRVADSGGFLFQAKVFASGHLYAKAPPLNDFFDYGYNTIINDGKKWYSCVFPGHPFMLMFGVLLGIPWVVGPFLVSISIVVIYLAGKEMYGQETALYAACLGIMSPFLLFISSTYMSHSTSLFFISFALFFFVRTIKYGRWFDPLLLGIFLGLELNTRTLASITLGVPLTIFMVYFIVWTKTVRLKNLLIFIVPCVIFSGFFLFYNYMLTGDPLLTAYEQYRPDSRFGFGEALPNGGYTPAKGLFRNFLNMYNLNETLFGWPGLSLLFLPVFLFSKKNKWDYILFAFFALTIFVHYFHWAQDTRRWFATLPALLLLTLRGMQAVPALLEKLPPLNRVSKVRMASTTVVFVCFLCLQSFAIYFPKIITQYQNSFWDADDVLFQPIDDQKVRNALIFMDVSNTNYDLGFARMSPDLKDEILLVRDLGEKNERLMRQYPERTHYLLSFDEQNRKAQLTPLLAP